MSNTTKLDLDQVHAQIQAIGELVWSGVYSAEIAEDAGRELALQTDAMDVMDILAGIEFESER